MKRLFVFVAVISFLTAGCDDGELVFEDIDFNEVAAQRCNNKIYKLNGAEALILKIGDTESDADFTDAFPFEPSIPGTPHSITIDNEDYKVVYRLYDGDVTTSNICGAIPAAFPAIVEEWEATSGTIEITTTAEITANTATGFEGGEKIDAYQHNIVFRNITFQKNDGSSQVYDVFPFGVYNKGADALNFNFGALELQKCPNSSRVYKTIGTAAISLNLNPVLFDTTNPGEVKTGLIGPETNAFVYHVFPTATTIEPAFLCSTQLPVTPLQTWTGITGVEGMSGVVEVVSTTLPGGNGYSHEIRLKKVFLKRGRNEFLLADDYLLGELNITD